MRTVLLILAVMTPLAAVDKPAAGKPAPAAAAQPAAKAVEIPARAVETQPGTFSYTDLQGRKWIYRQTPFGVVRMGEKPDAPAGSAQPGALAAAAAAPAPAVVNVKVEDNGDTVHFERPGPFGLFKWDRKKGDLTDEERGWLERSRSAPSAATKQN